MRASTFDFLDQVGDITIVGDHALVCLQHKNRYAEIERIVAKCKIREFDEYMQPDWTSNPEQAVTVCFYGLTSDIALVQDFRNLHAIIDMPFELAIDQISIINDYLRDMTV